MSKSYVVVSALIFALVAFGHLLRLVKSWPVQIGPRFVPMSVSWIGLAVATLLAVWGFAQLDY
jgi:hypothetical protein